MITLSEISHAIVERELLIDRQSNRIGELEQQLSERDNRIKELESKPERERKSE